MAIPPIIASFAVGLLGRLLVGIVVSALITAFGWIWKLIVAAFKIGLFLLICRYVFLEIADLVIRVVQPVLDYVWAFLPDVVSSPVFMQFWLFVGMTSSWIPWETFALVSFSVLSLKLFIMLWQWTFWLVWLVWRGVSYFVSGGGS